MMETDSYDLTEFSQQSGKMSIFLVLVSEEIITGNTEQREEIQKNSFFLRIVKVFRTASFSRHVPRE